jgi:hypothetical protein
MAAGIDLDLNLLNYCVSDQEKLYLRTTAEVGSMTGAAKVLKLNYGTIHQAIDRVRVRAAKMGYAPEHHMTHSTTAPFLVKGTSTLYDEEGKPKLQWVKTDLDRDRVEKMVREFIAAAAEEIPREKPNKSKPKDGNPDLLNLFVISDYHFGALAYGEATRGEDWDVKIAEQMLVAWFREAIDRAPKAAGALCCFLGDDLHFDSLEAVTPASKHLLDADTRFEKIVRLWIRVRRQINQMLLDRYPWVHCIEAEGNHNPVASLWMREWMAAHYENEPRLTVDQSADPYYCYEWGQVSLFFHHGHKRKPTNVDDVFASKFREVFGRTKHSYAHMGHMHHRQEYRESESNLMAITQHRTLAASDSYASRLGFNSGREAQVITYHKEYGECGRVMVTPEMISAA